MIKQETSPPLCVSASFSAGVWEEGLGDLACFSEAFWSCRGLTWGYRKELACWDTIDVSGTTHFCAQYFPLSLRKENAAQERKTLLTGKGMLMKTFSIHN